MEIIPVKTRVILPPKDDIYNVLDEFCPALREGDVFVITSKILAIHQGRCLALKDVVDKNELIKKEADAIIPLDETQDHHFGLTIKGNTLIAFAGIDESNAAGYYILWPKDPAKEAEAICKYLKNKFSINDLAVIISDSHCLPMRRGTMGISIGFYGLEPLNDYRDKKDIFGRPFEITQANIVDALTVMAVVAMGEGDEQKPMAIIRNAAVVKFTNKPTSNTLSIPIKEDIFYPLLKPFIKP